PAMATIRPGILTPARADAGRRAEIIALPVNDVSSRMQWQSGEFTTDEGVHLDNAKVIVSVGTGVGGSENLARVQELCSVLDAHLGATRKVVDKGWLPRQLQIGLTGRSVAPQLYVALGVRGAFNHTVGIQRSGIIFAVNNDPNADIFKQCDYGIVGDWRAVTTTLLRVLREQKSPIANQKS
ncbi:MAG: electron transfer flavoprotein subunit alpha/FixB family protein, partial [Chloroflexi bacterium]|nr:electron transfer flavoprotein subunit alpha/FixB family protein [Chloroflexota bacterium]